jgi:flagella basal body P-ring formation protein FlgA
LKYADLGDNAVMRNLCALVFWTLLLFAPNVWPGDNVDHAEIHKVAMAFVQVKTQSLPGKVTLKVDEIDPRIVLSSCSKLEAFMPAGASMLGKTSIGVRCNEKNGWSLFMSATITSTMNMLVSSKPLQQGQIIRTGDFNIHVGEISQPVIVTDELQVVGKVIKFSIGAGQLLKQDMFRPPYSVTQGQTVQLIAEGDGFKLRSEGIAMVNAVAGQAVQVKVPSGQIISGIAQNNGSVEILK